jgi:hypothetical protein
MANTSAQRRLDRLVAHSAPASTPVRADVAGLAALMNGADTHYRQQVQRAYAHTLLFGLTRVRRPARPGV